MEARQLQAVTRGGDGARARSGVSGDDRGIEQGRRKGRSSEQGLAGSAKDEARPDHQPDGLYLFGARIPYQHELQGRQRKAAVRAGG
eukprot:8468978-Pyramimonas_sp.AAC.1